MIAQTTTPRKSTAFYAYLGTEHGIAMRDPKNRVWFGDDQGGAWVQLTDADAPRLTLLGRVDVATAQQLADGNIFEWIERRNTEQARGERAAATPVFGAQTLAELAHWLIPADEHAAFWALPRHAQLERLANRAHAKREYMVRNACRRVARSERAA